MSAFCRRISGFLPRVVATGFRAVSADFHVAPSAAMILGVIDKKPGAIVRRTHSNERQIRRGQKICGGPGDWPQDGFHVVLRRDPLPTEISFVRYQTRVLRSLLQNFIEHAKSSEGNHAAFAQRVKDIED